MQEMETTASSTSLEKTFQLPDGRVIIVGKERFRYPETLLQPKLFGLSGYGIHETLCNSIIKCYFELRNKLYVNIVCPVVPPYFLALLTDYRNSSLPSPPTL